MRPDKKQRNIKKSIWIFLGFVFVVLGSIGIPLPLLPTTPFLLLAAGCFSRGSETLYTWLTQSPVLGKYIKDYNEGKGIPFHGKVISILFLWIGILYSMSKAPDILLAKITLLIVATAVSIHIASIKRIEKV